MPCLGDEADWVRSCGAHDSFKSAPDSRKRQRVGWFAALRVVRRSVPIGGAIAGNAGKGAAIGAGAGGLLGTVRRNDQVRQEESAHQQWAQQNVAQYEQNRSSWVRAVKACLTGRGYTVQ